MAALHQKVRIRAWTPCLLACLSLSGVPNFGLAQGAALGIKQMHHLAWTAKDGVPDEIAAMAQTPDGYVWLGGGDGLTRFDGVRFEHYVPHASIGEPGANIKVLKAASDGGLWIGWQIGGISLLKDGVLTNYSGARKVFDGTVWGFAFDLDGRVWASGAGGLARYDHGQWHVLGPADGYPSVESSAVFVDSAGTVGAFSEKGLFLMPRGATVFRAPIGKLDTTQPPQQGPHGQLYFLEKDGIRPINSLTRYDRHDSPWLFHGHSYTVLADATGSVWFDTEHALHRVARAAAPSALDAKGMRADTENYTQSDGLSGTVVYDMLEDSQGEVLISTNGGLDQFNRSDIVPVLPQDSTISTEAEALLAARDGHVLISSPSSGWLAMAADGSASARTPALRVNAAVVDRDGVAWLGADKAIFRQAVDGKLRRIDLPAALQSKNIYTVARAPAGGVWVALRGGGVWLYSNATWHRETDLPGAGAKTPLSMLGDAEGRSWFGYIDNTIIMLASGEVHRFSSAQGVDIGRVATLYEHDGQLWAAGERGLALYRAGRFQAVHTVALDTLHNIADMLIDPAGDMWLNGSTGLVHIAAKEWHHSLLDTRHQMQARIYDSKDGVVGKVSLLGRNSLALADDGKLWFYTAVGLFYIDTQHLLPRHTTPRAVLQRLVAGARTYEDVADADLSAGTSALQFDFTAPSPATGRSLTFRYRLAGYDDRWQQAGARRQAFYTGVPPGHYRFLVEVAGPDGRWRSDAASIAVHIAPAWYETLWFRLACAAAIIGGALATQRVVRARRANTDRRLVQERQQERERIARELHDTLLQTNHALLLKIHRAAGTIPAHDPTRHLLEGALDQAEAALEEGYHRILDLRRSDDIADGLPGALRQAGAKMLADAQVARPAAGVPRLQVDVGGLPRPLTLRCEYETYRIVGEAMRNVVRHAGATEIEVLLKYGKTGLAIAIRDNGHGMAPGQQSSGSDGGHWGLPGMHERVGQLGGFLEVHSTEHGTALHFTVPGRVAYAVPQSKLTTWLTVWRSRGTEAKHKG